MPPIYSATEFDRYPSAVIAGSIAGDDAHESLGGIISEAARKNIASFLLTEIGGIAS
jgi:hypothetical protein